MAPHELVDRVVALVPGAAPAPADLVRGQAVVVVPRDAIAAAFPVLRDHADLRFDFLADVTCVDWLGRTPRFEVVYQLVSLPLRHRLRVKVPVGEDDPVVPSATGTWAAANWAEREAWDMFGVRFAGHPDLRRILMYASFEGHPLRKDYQLDRRQPLVPEREPLDHPWFPRTGNEHRG